MERNPVRNAQSYSEQQTGLCLKQTTYILEQSETGVGDSLVQAITSSMQ